MKVRGDGGDTAAGTALKARCTVGPLCSTSPVAIVKALSVVCCPGRSFGDYRAVGRLLFSSVVPSVVAVGLEDPVIVASTLVVAGISP